jgi:hypothetical protein
MENVNKPRLITDYEKLGDEIKEQIKMVYPYGFSQNLITFTNKEGRNINGLRFEVEDKIYLIRMTVSEADEIVDQDDDFDDDGNLRDDIKDEYEDKYSDDLDDLADFNE